MAEERRRIKRREVSSETRRGSHRAAVNPNARTADVGAGEREGQGESRRIRRER